MSRHQRGAAPRLAGAALVTVAALVAPAPAVPGDSPDSVERPSAATPEAGSPARPAGSGGGLPAALARRDQVREEQWQLDELRATHAWRHSTGDGVTVAVVDSGVDAGHPDLAGQVLPGIDLVSDGGDGRTDPVGHGTTVAGLIAGRSDDDSGVMGLAPRAKILPVRVLDAENRYDDALIVAKGVRWAVDNGARVINLSLGGSGTSPALAAALDYAFARDVVVVACTGNHSSDPAPAAGQPSPATEVWYPAREPGVLAVTGLDRETESLWSGSITGSATVLSAPATGLVGARPGGTWKVQGTSFAAPLVTATAALVRAKWPEMSAATVVNRLITTATDLGAVGRDDRYGYGLVDPVAALTVGVSTVTHNPLDTNAPHGVAGFGAAPGVAVASSGATSGHEPVGGRAQGIHTDWTAQPAGEPEHSKRGWAVGFGALVTLVAAAAAVLVRRRTRSRA
ncbi:type VII secretion-associated serine protease mycosin [Phytohabitans maris]|uniref:type VII secretion-associated serine protease mycosin n=1 Tax=Phytohabitans maris TaxID=3071409 RepID=UPI003D1760E0